MQRSIYLNRDKKMRLFRLKIHRPKWMRRQRDIARALLNPNPPAQPIPPNPVSKYSALISWVPAASFATRAFLKNIPKGITLRNVSHGEAQAGNPCPLLVDGGRSMKFFNNAELGNLGRIVVHFDGTEDKAVGRVGCSVVGRFHDTGLLAFYIYGELEFTQAVKAELVANRTVIEGTLGELGGLWVMEYMRASYGLTDLEVAGDSRVVLGYINHQADQGRLQNITNPGHRFIAEQLMEIRNQAGNNRPPLFWVHRSFNEVADRLASQSLYHELNANDIIMQEIWGWIEKERRIGFAEFMRRAYADERWHT